MAVQLSETRTCDWHAVLPDPAKVEATAERTNPKGTVNDLCNVCALLFDLAVPRLDEILAQMHPETLEQLFRVGRTPPDEKKTHRPPAQLAIPAEAPPPATPKTATWTKKPPNGAWRDDVVQVICPLTHRAGNPSPYWVGVRDRGSHARSSHKLYGPEVDYKLEPGQEYTVFCEEHEVCARAGGFGFLNEDARRLHMTKTQEWPKAA